MTNKNFGFTLAEVLITLSIIGVVAALTLPTLLANYQKKEWVTRLIKTHAEITQNLTMLLAKSNTSSLSETNPWNLITEDCPFNKISSSNIACTNFMNELLKSFDGATLLTHGENNYTNFSQLNGVPATYSSNRYYVKLKNGATIVWSTFHKVPKKKDLEYTVNQKFNSSIASIRIDVNGEKGPNIVGRDTFSFIISDDGILHPQGSMEFSLYSKGDDSGYWRTSELENFMCDSKNPLTIGFGCTARVLEEGKMDY